MTLSRQTEHRGAAALEFVCNPKVRLGFRISPSIDIIELVKESTFFMSTTVVQIICGVLAVVLVGIVIMRRKGKKKDEDEDF